MRKVKILETNKIVTVSNNVAFGLIDAGKATFYLSFIDYPNRMLKPRGRKGYKTK